MQPDITPAAPSPIPPVRSRTPVAFASNPWPRSAGMTGRHRLDQPVAISGIRNLMIFAENHALIERLEPTSEEQLGWRSWAQEHGLIAK